LRTFRDRAVALSLGILAAWASACDRRPAATGLESAPGPHGGIAVALPRGLGYAESRVESPRGSDPKRNSPSVVATYFLAPDLKRPLTPPPTSVVLRVKTDDRKTIDVATDLRPNQDDPAAGARFVTKPGQYVNGSIRGTLIVTVGGEQVTVPLVVR
jgi:hypothetical protein